MPGKLKPAIDAYLRWRVDAHPIGDEQIDLLEDSTKPFPDDLFHQQLRKQQEATP